jgi:hypothetical protein
MKMRPHQHPCQRCFVLTECCGDIEQNIDGIPEWVCVEFDTQDHSEFYCDACQDALSTLGNSDQETPDTEGSPAVGSPNILRGGPSD